MGPPEFLLNSFDVLGRDGFHLQMVFSQWSKVLLLATRHLRSII